MHRALADLELHANPSSAFSSTPPGVMILHFHDGGITVQPQGSLLYYPEIPTIPEIASGLFTEAEQTEFIHKDLSAAARLYSNSATNANATLRASALTKLAAVYRKNGAPNAALEAYDRLFQISDVAG